MSWDSYVLSSHTWCSLRPHQFPPYAAVAHDVYWQTICPSTVGWESLSMLEWKTGMHSPEKAVLFSSWWLCLDLEQIRQIFTEIECFSVKWRLSVKWREMTEIWRKTQIINYFYGGLYLTIATLTSCHVYYSQAAMCICPTTGKQQTLNYEAIACKDYI